MEIVITILIFLISILLFIVANLYRKVLKQEDIIEYQIDYLRKVSETIVESKLYIDKLDDKGIFRADDEVGTFFNFMKEIQNSIDTFRLPEDYGKTSKK